MADPPSLLGQPLRPKRGGLRCRPEADGRCCAPPCRQGAPRCGAGARRPPRLQNAKRGRQGAPPWREQRQRREEPERERRRRRDPGPAHGRPQLPAGFRLQPRLISSSRLPTPVPARFRLHLVSSSCPAHDSLSSFQGPAPAAKEPQEEPGCLRPGRCCGDCAAPLGCELRSSAWTAPVELWLQLGSTSSAVWAAAPWAAPAPAALQFQFGSSSWRLPAPAHPPPFPACACEMILAFGQVVNQSLSRLTYE
ncbi:uncharacterized protein VSU04_004014 [Chlamydotis macqueenii]